MTSSGRDEDDAMRYPSRIDWWLMGPIFAVPLVVSGLSLASEPGHRWVLLGVAGVTAVLTILFLLPCHYILTKEVLVVRCGVFRWRLALGEIREIELSGSWMSGPALSLRRIRIEMNSGNEFLISPEDREGFLAEVQARRGVREG